MVAQKVCAVIGMGLTACGTILLWRGGPSGHSAMCHMGNNATTASAVKNNRRMFTKQTFAIAIIVIGTALQIPAALI
jgi:preprotein translocase subunit SecG